MIIFFYSCSETTHLSLSIPLFPTSPTAPFTYPPSQLVQQGSNLHLEAQVELPNCYIIMTKLKNTVISLIWDGMRKTPRSLTQSVHSQQLWERGRKCFGGRRGRRLGGLTSCLETYLCAGKYKFINIHAHICLYFCIYNLYTDDMVKYFGKTFWGDAFAEILLGKQTERCYKDPKAASKTEIPLRPVPGAVPGYKIQNSLQQYHWDFCVRRAKFHRQDSQSRGKIIYLA